MTTLSQGGPPPDTLRQWSVAELVETTLSGPAPQDPGVAGAAE